MFDAEAMGGRIRMLRNHHGWTQEELAAKAGISYSFLGHIERGTRQASLETLVILAKTLEASCDFLLTGEDTVVLTPEQAHVLWDVASSMRRGLGAQDGEEE